MAVIARHPKPPYLPLMFISDLNEMSQTQAHKRVCEPKEEERREKGLTSPCKGPTTPDPSELLVRNICRHPNADADLFPKKKKKKMQIAELDETTADSSSHAATR